MAQHLNPNARCLVHLAASGVDAHGLGMRVQRLGGSDFAV